MRNLVLSLSTAVLAAAAPSSAGAAECTYRIVIYGMASSNTFAQRTDDRTVEQTTTTRIGTTASSGTLVLRTDGTYEIRGYLGLGPKRSGRWIDNAEGPFSERGGIELLEVKGAEYGPNNRSWFVYTDDDGNLVAREPPYTAYETLALKNASGAECASRAEKAPRMPAMTAPSPQAVPPAGPLARPGTSATNGTSSVTLAQPSGPAPVTMPPGGRRDWTMQEFRRHFMGMSREQVVAELGEPQSRGYKQLAFGRLSLRDADDPSSTARVALISFTEQDGGEVWHIGFSD